MDLSGGGELGGVGDCGDFAGCEVDGGEEPMKDCRRGVLNET